MTTDFDLSADQDVSFISSEDMIFHSQGGAFDFVALGDIETQNSPESGGDLILHAGSPSDTVFIAATNEILLVTGEDWIGDNTGALSFSATGADSLDQFGIRIQTEAVGGDIDILSNGFTGLSSNTDLTATTLSGDIRMASGLFSTFRSDTLEVCALLFFFPTHNFFRRQARASLTCAAVCHH